jgi:hypothetical protein
VVHEHKRLGRGLELAALAEQLRAAGIGLEFLSGELQGSHDPSGVVFTVLAALSGMEREGPLEVGEQLPNDTAVRCRRTCICGYAWNVPTVICPRCETRQPPAHISN